MRRYPLLILIIITWIGLAGYTVYSKGTGVFTEDNIKKPVFAALLDKNEEDNLDELLEELSDVEEPEDTKAQDVSSDTGDEPLITFAYDSNGERYILYKEGMLAGDMDGDAESKDPTSHPAIKPKYEKYEPKKVNSKYYKDPGKYPLTTERDYITVDKDYFDDALFLGDSRTVNIKMYAGLDKATFYAKTSMNIYRILTDEFVTDPDTGAHVTVPHMLKKKHFKKIYISLGINELGIGDTEYFKEAYKKVIKKVHKLQPDAVIYVQSILYVSESKDKSDSIINNTNIRDKNVAIASLTNGNDIIFLNVNEPFEDGKGNLRAEVTRDQVHLYPEYCSQWVDFLMEHAVEVKE